MQKTYKTAEFLMKISNQINQISTVVQTNSSISEKNAASEELASLPEIFKKTISKFELKN